MNTIIMILLIVVPTILVIVISSIAANKQKKIKKEIEEDIKKGNFDQVEIKQKTSQKKISKLIGTAVLLPILSIGVILFFTIGGCSSDVKTPILVLEQEGLNYVFHGNSFFLENDIEKGGFVDLDLFSKVIIYPLKDGIYMDPNDIQGVSCIATGQFNLIEYDQGSHQGFVVISDSAQFTIENKTIPTEKIGKSILEYTIFISDGDKELVIQWNKDNEIVPIRNCVIKSVWEVSNPYPGKTVGNYRDKLLVNVSEVLRFFNSNAQMTIEEDGELLVIRLE